MDPDCDAAKNFEGVDVSGHTYTWDLHESDGRTEVTETYEWTGVKDPQFEKLFPLVSQEDLETLARQARRRPSADPRCRRRPIAADTGQRILRGPVSSRRGWCAEHHAGADHRHARRRWRAPGRA